MVYLRDLSARYDLSPDFSARPNHLLLCLTELIYDLSTLSHFTGQTHSSTCGHIQTFDLSASDLLVAATWEQRGCVCLARYSVVLFGIVGVV
jgi:hypothetical protein